VLSGLADPADPQTFERCKLVPAERATNHLVVDLHRDLLRLRREDPTFRAPRIGGIDGAVLEAQAFILRFFGATPGGSDDRLLLVNLGRAIRRNPGPEPLLAPPLDCRWETLWTSDDPKYGGGGTPALDTTTDHWEVPGHTAVVLRPRKVVSSENAAKLKG
jgi:maltooligosyltrehalose trehalohydrolase